MKLVEVLPYTEQPVIELSKLPSGFDEDLLVDMVKEHEANIFIDGADLEDILADGAGYIAQRHLSKSKYADRIPMTREDYQYDELLGGFDKIAYSPEQHALFCQYDMAINYTYKGKLSQKLVDDTLWIDGVAKVKINKGKQPWLLVAEFSVWPTGELIDLTNVCHSVPEFKQHMK
jgi:hypothetical protein